MTACVARYLLAPVKPERPRFDAADGQQAGSRPRVVCQARPDLLLIYGVNGVQGLLAVAERTADKDESICH